MFDIIYGNLDRQTRGLALLHSLLREEYDLLCARKAEDVMALELSIHELLRQLAVEKQEVRTLLGGGRLLDYAAMLDEDAGGALRELWETADEYEQICSRQATQNCEISIALLDVSKDMVEYLYSRILPPQKSAYGPAGAYTQTRPEAVLISGRL
jgi:flagellar biosynthesis/type III secretory pathway chaperone